MMQDQSERTSSVLDRVRDTFKNLSCKQYIDRQQLIEPVRLRKNNNVVMISAFPEIHKQSRDRPNTGIYPVIQQICCTSQSGGSSKSSSIEIGEDSRSSVSDNFFKEQEQMFIDD